MDVLWLEDSCQSQLDMPCSDGQLLMRYSANTALSFQSRAWCLRAILSVQVSLWAALCRRWPAC